MRRLHAAQPASLSLGLALVACSAAPVATPVIIHASRAPICSSEAIRLLEAVASLDDLVAEEPTFADYRASVDAADERYSQLDLSRVPAGCVRDVIAPLSQALLSHRAALDVWRECGGEVCPFSDAWSSMQDRLAEARENSQLARRMANE